MEQPGAGSDLVGRTSARLLAAGVDRRERLDALHLLAILDASIDSTGRVRRPLDDLAGEFELPALSVLRSLDHLERVGAVQRDGGHVLLLGASPEGLGGMQLAGFLDDVRSSFAGEVPAARRSGWIARSGAALVATAAAVAVLTLAPGQSTIDQPLALRGAGTTAVAQSEDTAPPDLDPPIARTRPSATIGASTAAPALDATVVAAQAPAEECVPTSSVADRVDCVIDDGLIVDGDEVVPDRAPVAPEPTAPPAPKFGTPSTPESPSPVTTTPDLSPATDSIKGVSRTFRS